MSKIQEPKYLNLAHQFLDTNFIESVKSNNFNLLPVISTNPVWESFVRTDPPLAVDYFSYDLTPKQYHSCWKNISNNQFMKPYELSNVDNVTRLRTVQPTDDLMIFLPTTSQARLENACWRAWYKKLKNLNELDPTEINWFKENDVTVLYGPLIEEENIEHISHIKTDKVEIHEDIFHDADLDSDCKMSENWNSDFSSASECESDADSILLQRRYSIESNRTSISSFNNVGDNINESKLPNENVKQLKGILKKRKNIYTGKEFKSAKKRISFSQELSSIRFIV